MCNVGPAINYVRCEDPVNQRKFKFNAIMAVNFQALQPTLQATLTMFLTSLLTFVRPISFSLACLAAVFVVVLHLLLVQNFHVGTQILSAASLLGAVWSGIAAAGIMVSISMQIPSRAGDLALRTVLASFGFAMFGLVRVSARQFPQLFLQGTNGLMTFGMSLVLSLWAPSVNVLWNTYLAHMLLAFTAAGLASILSGLLVLPSLATEAAMQLVITALNRTGKTGTTCVSILLAPLQPLAAHKPSGPSASSLAGPNTATGDVPYSPSEGTSQPAASALAGRTGAVSGAQDSPSGAVNSILPQQPTTAEDGADAIPHRQQLGGNGPDGPIMQSCYMQQSLQPQMMRQQHQQQLQRWRAERLAQTTAGAVQLQQAASLLLEDDVSSGALSSALHLTTQPGQWGLTSFLAVTPSVMAFDQGGSPAATSTGGQGLAAKTDAEDRRTVAVGAGAGDHFDEEWGWDHYPEEDSGSVDQSAGSNLVTSSSHHSASSPRSPTSHMDMVSDIDSARSPTARHRIGVQHSSKPVLNHDSGASKHHHRGALSFLSRFGISSITSNNSKPQPQQPSSPTSHHSKHGSGSAPTLASAAVFKQHPLLRLERGVDQIRPLLQAAKQLHTAVTVESAWWVGLLVGRSPSQGVDPVAWAKLVEALEGLVNRVAALESMLEGGHEAASLAQLSSYRALATTCGAIFAQAGALCATLSTALQNKLKQQKRQGDLTSLCSSWGNRQSSRSSSSGHAHTEPDTAPPSAPTVAGSLASASVSGYGNSSRSTTCRVVSSAQKNLFLAAAVAASEADDDATSVADQLPAWAMDEAFLCSTSSISPSTWIAAKQRLVYVLQFETQQYYQALALADKHRPFRLDPARSMIALMFLCMLSLGVIEACQKLQDAVEAVAGSRCPVGGSPGRPAGATAANIAPSHDQQPQQVQQRGIREDSSSATDVTCVPAASMQADMATQQPPRSTNGRAGPTGTDGILSPDRHTFEQHHPSTGSTPTITTTTTAGSRSKGSWHAVWKQVAQPMRGSTQLLLNSFLMIDVANRIWDALGHQLPAALKSRQAFTAQLHDRRFQAGFKLWLVSTVAFVVVVGTNPSLAFLQSKAPSVFMFGFMSLVFTMRERVESSMEMVISRVGATAVGACAAHALMFNPVTAYNPWILGASLIFFTLVLTPASLGQFKLVVVLGLLTFTSVILCQYVGCCGAVGSTTYLVGRIAATGGGALFAMMLNRLLWPWYRNRWAMEELSTAFDIAVTAAINMYYEEYRRVAGSAGISATSGIATASNSQATVAATCRRPEYPCTPELQRLAAVAEPPSPAGSREVVIEVGHEHALDAAPRHDSKTSSTAAFITVTTAPVASPTAVAKPAEPANAASAVSSAAGSVPGAASNATVQGGLPSPEELQRTLAALLVPVQISIARDTWITWKRGALAVAKSVHLMMAAVQQLLDAMSALSVTLKLVYTTQQLQTQGRTTSSQPLVRTHLTNGAASQLSANTADAGSFTTSASHAVGASGCGQWQQQLLFHELAEPVHGSFCQVLCQLSELVVLVKQQLRQPSAANREALRHQIEKVHMQRVQVSMQYIALRNQRHRKMRQQLAAVWPHRQQQQPPPNDGSQAPHSGHLAPSSAVPVPARPGSLMQHAAQPVTDHTGTAGVDVSPPAAVTTAACDSFVALTAEGGAAPAPAAAPVGQQQQSLVCDGGQDFQHQVLATVQYMAVVHALRRFFDRALAVARCAADAKF